MKSQLLSALLVLTAAGVAAPGVRAQAPAPTPTTELVYLQQLPTVASLMSAAKTEGVAVVKIDQTSTAITAVYKDANGQINTVSYELLPAGEAAGAVAPAPAAPAPAPATVVYQTAAPAYYYSPYYGPYYPWGWYPPVSIGVGFGFRGHWR